MIEKVMKAVKRNSKRRSVNITIGAVVGFLLSCTTVMGAAVKIEGYGTNFAPNIEIDGNTFENNTYTNNGRFEKDKGGILVSGEAINKELSIVNNGSIETKYNGIEIGEDTKIEGDITNNGTIVSEKVGILLTNAATEVTGKITNNGTISSTEDGIKISGKLTAKGDKIAIENNGEINSVNNNDGESSRSILLNGTLTGNIENNGVLNSTAANSYAYGISTGVDNTGEGILKNAGIINTASNGTKGDSHGIIVNGTLTGNIENTGTINTAHNGTGKSYGIMLYQNSSVSGILKNTGIINSTSEKNSGYGVYIRGSLAGNMENDGIINTTSNENYACGIYIHADDQTTKDIINRGLISAAASLKDYAIGIGNFGTTKKVLNTGYINVSNINYSIFGITTGSNGKVDRITNNGNIYVGGNNLNFASGISVESTPEGGTDILNNGLINTTNDGIEVRNEDTLAKSLSNGGVIYGKEKAIAIVNKAKLGDGTKANYGLLISEGNDRDSILNGTNFETIQNYGMAFSVGDEGKYYVQESKSYTNEGRTVINAELDKTGNYDSTGEVRGTESVLSASLNDNGQYIINGIENTLVVNKDITLKTSIINAYGTAVVMKDGKVLTVEGTIFNGGIKIKSDKAEGNIPTPTISLAGNNNTLNLSKESIVNGNMEIGGGNNTLIMNESNMNGKVTAGGGSNKLTVAGSYLNDEMTITEDNNTLNMSKSSINGKMAATGDSNNLTIADSYLNDELAITGDNNTLSMDKSSMNGIVKAEGDNNNLTIAESGINDEIKIDGNKNALKVTDSNLNKNIAIDGDENTLTISGDNTFINGDMDATGEKNTVNLAGKSTDGSSLNMFNKVTGFENMDITGGNVTFFENAEVKGVEKLTVAADGTLNLRLKKDGEAEGGLAKGVHAFSGNGKMEMKGLGDDGGTLQFITNGIGEGVWINTSDMDIKNMVVKTNSVLDGFKFDEGGEGLTLKAADSLADMNKSGDKVINSTTNEIESKPGDGSGEGPDDGPGDDSNIGDSNDIFEHENFDSIDGIYKGIFSSTNKNDNLDALRDLAMIDRNTGDLNEVMSKEEQMKNLQAYLNEIYTQSPYALSSELSRRSAGMFRDIVTENMFRPNLNQWMIMGGLTHIDGGTKDTYYGEVYQLDGKNSLNTEADMKLTGAYALGKYGYSENVALGVTVGGNRSEAELSKSKVKGNSGYIGAFAENYRGNLTLKAGAGIQYSEYDADRSTVGGHSYNDKYSDMTYDIYLNGRYSNPVGENLFLEPYATLSYTYVDQEGTDEGSKALAIKTDSKSFEYTSAEVGVDLKKVIPHEKGKSTLSAGVSYTRLFNGADSDKLTGSFGGSDFDILVAGKNKHNLGLNAKYTLELQSGVLFDVKGSYSFERDSHKDNARNRNKGEWMVGAGLGYKF